MCLQRFRMTRLRARSGYPIFNVVHVCHPSTQKGSGEFEDNLGYTMRFFRQENKKVCVGGDAGEHATIPEGLGSIPSTLVRWLITTYNSSFRVSVPLASVDTHTRGHTHTHTNIKINLK